MKDFYESIRQSKTVWECQEIQCKLFFSKLQKRSYANGILYCNNFQRVLNFFKSASEMFFGISFAMVESDDDDARLQDIWKLFRSFTYFVLAVYL